MNRRLVVELHDVAPPFEAEIREQLRLLDAIGVQRYVLLVVPNWHGAYPLNDYPTFAALLQSRVAAGSELALHGLTHRRRGPVRSSLLDRWRARAFAGDHAEFLTMTRIQAREAVDEGMRVIDEAALPAPTAFCAPAWLLSLEGSEGVRDAGLGRVVGMLNLVNTSEHRRHVWPAFGYMGAGRRQELGVQAMNGLVVPAAGCIGRARAYLHPQHIERPSHARVVRCLEKMLHAGWTTVTYEELWPSRVPR